MQVRSASVILAAFAVFVPFIANAETASKPWHPESVSQREADLSKEFEAKSLKLGSPVFLRVYKHTSEMELWVQQGPRYVHFKTYGICRWSGGLGPKHYEGDRQSPEGLYRITTQDLIVNPRWDRAMNINYPNSFDRVNGRSGSSILIHGGCGSIGCFAIQNQNVEDVYGAVRAALKNGQAYIPVLALPFRFSELAPEKQDTLQMNEFWADLRRADLLFERDKLPPVAWICDGRYYFSDRRGDRHRHSVHLPGCRPLDKSPGTRDAKKSAPEAEKPIVSASAEQPAAAAAATEDKPLATAAEEKPAVTASAEAPQKAEAVAAEQAALKSAASAPRRFARLRARAANAGKKSHVFRTKHFGHLNKAKRINS
jgi:murein L,D-transpeptidase YafK